MTTLELREREHDDPELRRFLVMLIAAVAAVRLSLVFAIDPAYEFHRDEFLYFAMADHFELWRMQFPPLIAMVAGVGMALFGSDHVLAARVPAALAATGLTTVALLIARRLGGGRVALLLTAIAMFASPLFVRPGVLMHPVIFDQLWYAVAALGLLRAAQGDQRGWMVLGVGVGLGGLTKFSAGFHAFGILVAVLATPSLRAALRTRWPYMSAALALSIALPSLAGQQAHGWPFLVQAQQLRESQLTHVDPLSYLADQPTMLGGAVLFVIAGAIGLARDPALRAARALGISGLAIVLLLLVLRGKAYYAGPAYVPLVAIGAVAVARYAASRAGRRWIVTGIGAGTAAAAVALLPAGSPVLSPAPMSRYATALGLTETNYGRTLSLPQDYADMTGWREEVAATARAWEALDPQERARTAVLGENYGRAGALARFGPALGLPYPISRDGDFWAWGHGSDDTRNLLVLGASVEDMAPFCARALPVGWVRNPLGVDEEQDVPITFCRGLRGPLREAWVRLGPDWG